MRRMFQNAKLSAVPVIGASISTRIRDDFHNDSKEVVWYIAYSFSSRNAWRKETSDEVQSFHNRPSQWNGGGTIQSIGHAHLHN